MICTYCTGSCKSNYHTITTMWIVSILLITKGLVASLYNLYICMLLVYISREKKRNINRNRAYLFIARKYVIENVYKCICFLFLYILNRVMSLNQIRNSSLFRIILSFKEAFEWNQLLLTYILLGHLFSTQKWKWFTIHLKSKLIKIFKSLN